MDILDHWLNVDVDLETNSNTVIEDTTGAEVLEAIAHTSGGRIAQKIGREKVANHNLLPASQE